MTKRAKRTRWGYQRDGVWVIEPRFERADPFHHGLAAVRIDGKYGYVDRSGAIVVPPRFFRAGPFFDGLFARVEPEDGQPSWIDRRGEVAFLHREQASDGLFAVRTEGFHAWDARWGYRDAITGEVVIEPRFASAGPFFGDFATASVWVPDVGGRHGLIDRRGAWVIEPTYVLSNGTEARGGLFAREEGGVFSWAVIHPVHGIVVPFEARWLKPDVSRLQTAWPPPSDEDRALQPASAKVAVAPQSDAEDFPFRFYGVGVGDLEPRLTYRVEFAERVDVRAAIEALSDLLPETSFARDGRFVAVSPREVGALGSHAVEERAVEVLRRVHAAHPIVEVVSLRIADYADSAWDRWSRRMQEQPNEGPLFGCDP